MGKELGDNPQDVEPVRVGRAATVLFVIGACIVVFLLVMTIRGCSVSKTVKSGQSGQMYETVVTEPSKNATNAMREPSNSGQNTPNFEGTVTAPVENSTSGNNSNSTTNNPAGSNNGGVVEVASPELSGVDTDYGMVIGKHIYIKNGSYIYGVNISIVINESSVMAEYFCPRKTYDSLKSGDSLEVKYQVDSNGNISIYSIAKG